MIKKKKPPTRAGLATPKAKRKVTPPKKAPAKAVAPVAEKTRTVLPHEVLVSPTIQNAGAIQSWGKYVGAPDFSLLVASLSEKVGMVQDGDMKPAEAMLYGQAMALQTIFAHLARRAATNDGVKQFQVNMTLALKAQAQCRSTLEALALIKNPMPYIKQANITNGPQQVNNGMAPAGTITHAEENQNQQNKLLEDKTYERPYLDIGATPAATRGHQALEAVGKVHRAKKPQG